MSAGMDRTDDAHRQPDAALMPDEQLAHDLSLILMYLSSWTERPGEALLSGMRFWLRPTFRADGSQVR